MTDIRVHRAAMWRTDRRNCASIYPSSCWCSWSGDIDLCGPPGQEGRTSSLSGIQAFVSMRRCYRSSGGKDWAPAASSIAGTSRSVQKGKAHLGRSADLTTTPSVVCNLQAREYADRQGQAGRMGDRLLAEAWLRKGQRQDAVMAPGETSCGSRLR